MNKMVSRIASTHENALLIISPDPFIGETYGGFLRTYNIARIASTFFEKVDIVAFGKQGDVECRKTYGNINVLQKARMNYEMNNRYIRALKRMLFGMHYQIRTLNIPVEKYYKLIQLEWAFFYNLMMMKNKKYVLNAHRLDWELTEQCLELQRHKLFYQWVSRVDKKTELAAMKNAAHVIVCSELEKEKIKYELGKDTPDITVIPNCVNINDYSLSKWDVQKKTSEKKVVFVGKLDYFPNQDAAALICTEIAPFAQDIKFIIVGSGRMENIKIPPNVHFTGYVSDTKPYVADADLCICPIRYGAGTRFKIIEYMALKKPVIATSKGAEGLEVTDGKNIIIEDKIENYPHIIKNLIFDAGDCERIGAAARKLIELKYDWQKYANVLRDVYEKTL